MIIVNRVSTKNHQVDSSSGVVTVQKSTGGAAHVSDAISISGFVRGTDLALTTTGAQTDLLAGGIYDVWTTADCFLKIGVTASDVTTTTGYPVWMGNVISLVVPDQERIGAIVASGTAVLSFHRVK